MGEKITQEECQKLFGDYMPMEAATILLDPKETIDSARHKLQAMAKERQRTPPQMKIPDEMVEMAARAVAYRNMKIIFPMESEEELRSRVDNVWPRYKRDLEAAVEAVAPLIARAENEACAGVPISRLTNLQSQGYRYRSIEEAFKDIEAAIRARHATTPSPTQSPSQDPAQ